MYEIYYTNQAKKDYQKLKFSHLKEKLDNLLKILSENPFQTPPPYELLIGDMSCAISRRINKQHRLVYQIFPKENAVKILRMWTHYE